MSRRRTGLCRYVLLVLIASGGLAACGSSKSTPTAPTGPTPTSTPPPAPTNFRLSEPNLDARSIVLAWDPVPFAENYVVEYGAANNPSGARRLETTGTAISLTDLVPDEPTSVRVRTKSPTGESGSAGPSVFNLPDMRDMTEALFFGTGPYGSGFFLAGGGSDFIRVGPPPTAHVSPGRMIGWPSGTHVRVRAAASGVPLDAVHSSIDQINQIAAGAVHANLAEVSDDVDEDYRLDEMAVVVRSDLTGPCRTESVGVAGCASMAFRSTEYVHFFGGVLFVKPGLHGAVIAHEIWHGVGLHHVTWQTQGIPRPLMNPASSPTLLRLSDIEADVVRRVFESGLRPGASRGEFYGRGLVKNP